MKKISTLFKKNPENLGLVINEVDPKNEWALMYSFPTRKFDGTSCAIIDGELYKRFDLKKGRKLPKTKCIPCQGPDKITGHHPHWVLCERSDKSNKYHFQAFDNLKVFGDLKEGTYELCGNKINGNPEKLNGHFLIRHGGEVLNLHDYTFEGIKSFLNSNDIEGIVFHHLTDGRMCKIRKSDFGIKR
jgi:hypothetical protein